MSPQDIARLDAFVDARFDDSVAFLGGLVRVPTDTPPGDNAPAAEKAAQLLEGLGYAVERHPVPADLVHGHGLVSVTNLVVRHRFGPGPTVALNAHGDVVPPGEGWTRAPYAGEIADGRMYGRGVAVSKSDFATYAFALDALKRLHEADHALHGAVELLFTYDEEMGGEIGPARLLAQKTIDPDFVIAAGFSYAIVTAHNGCLHLEVIVHGVAAHAAMPESGVDAMRAAVDIMQALYGLRATFAGRHSSVAGIGSPKLNIGLIAGGTNTNVVPALVRFTVERRIIPEEEPAEVEAEIRGVIDRAGAAHPAARVEVRTMLLARAFRPLPGIEPVVALIRHHGKRVFGEAIEAVGVPLYTDARLYSEAAIPTVLYGAGPRTILEANAKRADENLVLEDLRRATKVVAATVAGLLESAPGPVDRSK